MAGLIVKDINPNGSSSPNELIDIEGILYFVADSGSADDSSTPPSDGDNNDESEEGNEEGSQNTGANTGIGLWKSDGSDGGTRLIRSFDGISNLTEANGKLYFIAQDSDQYEIWSSDGTSAGTTKVDTLYPGSDNFAAYNLFAEDDTLFFSSSGPQGSSNGYELWRWEGDDVGTKLFKNLFPDRYITNQSIEVDDTTGEQTLTIETAEFSTNNPEFSTDSFPGSFTSAGGGNFFFTAYSTQTVDAVIDGFADTIQLGGIELWFSNGTENGTYPIPINNESYRIYNPIDGTASPPNLYDEYYTATGSSFPKSLTAFKKNLYFTANDGSNGFELWSISNQGVGEKLVKDIHPDGSSTPEELTVVGNRLFFTADDGSGRQLWVITEKNKVQKIEKSGEDPRHLTEIDGKLYYSAKSSKGREPWVIKNGKSAQQLQDINPGIRSSNPQNFQLIETKTKKGNQKFLYFSANGGERGIELWSQNISKNNSDVELFADIYSGPSSSDPRQLINTDQQLLFTANDGKRGRELWTIGPSIEGPSGNIGAKESTIEVYENQTFVYTFSSTIEDPDSVIWSINGGVDSKRFKIDKKTGALNFKSSPNYEKPNDFSRDNNYEVVIRATDDDLGLRADQFVTVTVLDVATSAGCTDDDQDNCESNPPVTVESSLVKNIRASAQSSNPEELYNHRGQLFFSANNGRNGQEPWVSQGSTESTKLFLDINKGKKNSSPASFTSYKQSLFFAANDGRNGAELWITDGKQKGTELVADIQPGEGSSSPSDLLVQNNSLYMAADDGLRGRELWRYDLKTDQAALVHDIRSGSRIGSNPSELTALNGNIIFAAEGNSYGRELWSSDGTKSGTKMMLDINPGTLDSDPEDFSLLQGDLYFTGNTYLYGRQILKLDGSGLNVTEIRGSLGEAKATEPDDLHASRDQLFFSAVTRIDPSDDSDNTTPSTGGTSDSGSDPGGFMVAADGIETKALDYIEDYNRNIDSYREFDNPEFLNFARFWADALATSILVENNDASLAEDWNQYYQPLSDQSLSTSLPIRIPEGIPSTAASRSTDSSPDGSTSIPSEDDNQNSLGRELWISNGKAKGNTLLKDINPGEGSSDPKGFVTVGTKTYFSANDGEFGEELWISDGTQSGTYMLSDINKGSKDSSPRSITEVDGVVYFSAKSENHGRELWRIGTPNLSTQSSKRSKQNNLSAKELNLTRLVNDKRGRGRLVGKKNTADEFIFSKDNQFGTKKADQITRFSRNEGDTIQLNPNSFAGIKKRHFKTTNTLQKFNRELERKSNIIYFEPTGELYFDQNGRKAGFGDPKESGLFAILKGAPDLNPTDIGLI